MGYDLIDLTTHALLTVKLILYILESPYRDNKLCYYCLHSIL